MGESDARQTNGAQTVSLGLPSDVGWTSEGLPSGVRRETVSDQGERVTLRLPRAQLEQLDFLISLGEFDDRSSAIRQAIRELIDARRSKVLAKVEETARLQAMAAGAVKADEVLRK